MASDAKRCILHADMDAFFAAVELLRHPELRGKPVVVGGRGNPHERGVVSTASYEARPYGIYSGMPLRLAYQRCPEAVFLPVDYGHYMGYSNTFKSILRDFSHVMEDAGVDEAFLDLTDMEGDALDIAQTIKQRIKEETGLTCSIGIAPNKLLAKLASDMDKPDGLVILTEKDIARRVWSLPVRRLWGVGPKTEEKLQALGVTTIGELAAMSEQSLVDNFGPAHGHYLYQAARGIDNAPLITHWEPKSLSHETTFQHDVNNWEIIDKTLNELTRELVERLQRQAYLAHNVTVKLRYADFDTHTHSKSLATATDDRELIQQSAQQCLHKFALIKKVRLVGIRLGGLSKMTMVNRQRTVSIDGI